MLCVVAGDNEEAAAHWRAGIKQALLAASTNTIGALGNVEYPAEFGLPELASVFEHASSCAYALNGLGDVSIRPFWWFERYRDRLSQHTMRANELGRLRSELTRNQELLASLRQELATREMPPAPVTAKAATEKRPSVRKRLKRRLTELLACQRWVIPKRM
jgi:hypothetical protein